MSAGKASEYDRIDTEHNKFGGSIMVTGITKIFNRTISTAIFPEDLKFGLLIPIPMPGRKDYTDKNNSHVITLLTTIGKLYDKVIKMRLIEDCHEKGIEVTCDIQEAGQHNVSSLHTSFIVTEAIHYANDEGSTVHVACLDVEKAFDKVWQNGLLYKLHDHGLNSTLWRTMQIHLNTLNGVLVSKDTGLNGFVLDNGSISEVPFQVFYFKSC